ncbi:MAG: DUF3383 family protein, partial [Haemophilus parainfluenzae]
EIKKLEGLNFSKLADFSAIANAIQAKLTQLSVAASVTYDEVGNRFIITSNTSGVSKDTEIFYAINEAGNGDYIGGLLKLEDGQATRVIGKSQTQVKAEKVEEALFNVAEVENSWYGFTFAAQLTDEQIESAAKYAQANDKLFG